MAITPEEGKKRIADIRAGKLNLQDEQAAAKSRNLSSGSLKGTLDSAPVSPVDQAGNLAAGLSLLSTNFKKQNKQQELDALFKASGVEGGIGGNITNSLFNTVVQSLSNKKEFGIEAARADEDARQKALQQQRLIDAEQVTQLIDSGGLSSMTDSSLLKLEQSRGYQPGHLLALKANEIEIEEAKKIKDEEERKIALDAADLNKQNVMSQIYDRGAQRAISLKRVGLEEDRLNLEKSKFNQDSNVTIDGNVYSIDPVTNNVKQIIRNGEPVKDVIIGKGQDNNIIGKKGGSLTFRTNNPLAITGMNKDHADEMAIKHGAVSGLYSLDANGGYVLNFETYAEGEKAGVALLEEKGAMSLGDLAQSHVGKDKDPGNHIFKMRQAGFTADDIQNLTFSGLSSKEKRLVTNAFKDAEGFTPGEDVAKEIEYETNYDESLEPLYKKHVEGNISPSDWSTIESTGRTREEFMDEATEMVTQKSKDNVTFALSTLDLIQTLTNNEKGRGGAAFNVGIIPFTKSRDYQVAYDALRSKLKLENLISLKEQGATFGALSEMELESIAQASTALNRGTSDPAQYKAAVEKIQTEILEKMFDLQTFEPRSGQEEATVNIIKNQRKDGKEDRDIVKMLLEAGINPTPYFNFINL